MTYHLDWLELTCPHCQGALSAEPSRDGEADEILRCEGCDRTYPVVLGIPDLRVFPDPYISAEGDQIKGRMLATRFDRLDLEGMIRMYYHITPETPPHDVELNVTRLLGAERRASATLEAWDALFGRVEGGAMLEVGCGTAPMLLAARSRFERLVGVDVSFRWLVVAKRRLADAGIRLPLVAACGEALPFRPGTFDTTVMESYLEITRDQDTAMREASRVLAPRGRILLATPNRFSVGPDPHIGVPGGGFLPAGVVNAIAKQRMARPPLRAMLTAPRLRALFRGAGLGSARVDLAPVTDAQLRTLGATGRLAAGWYNRMRTTPLLRQALFAVGPMFLAEGRKA